LPQRRAYRRFKTGAPVTFSWKANGQVETSRGTVQNISVEGMYVVAPMCPPEKSTVRCLVLFPALAQDAAPAECTVANTVGTVLRRETDESQFGFAVRTRALILEPRMNIV
jgi:PilZ domain